MNHRYKTKPWLTGIAALAFCFAAQGTMAQTGESGNIVAIFGQEKVEKTDEGEVFHHFRDGLLLPGGVGSGTLFNGQDMVAWMYATGNFKTPKAGDSIPYVYPQQAEAQMAYQSSQERAAAQRSTRPRFAPLPQWKYAEIAVDSLGRFQNMNMRSAYLYMSYDSPKEQVAILETSGGTRVYVNGYPREGDHYDFGYTLLPVKLKRGLNEFIHTPGRMGRITAKLVTPEKAVMFTQRDMTLPDLIEDEDNAKWAAIRVVNASEKALKDMSIRARLSSGEVKVYKTDDIMPLTTRKLKFQLPATQSANGPLTATLELLDKSGKVLDQTEIKIRKVSPSIHHERTFISNIDGSVQYYSVAPAIREKGDNAPRALVLSVHGASVEARNQARAYKSKDWVNVVAATNRRPYGFNWEEWGRIDALEVLAEAKRVFPTDTTRVYLTGHSMGGHGTWFLGTNYPDKFAAIAPCASYPDIAQYGSQRGDAMHSGYASYSAFQRGANAGRVMTLERNLTQSGVYIFHGDADRVVHTDQARMMRERLGKFHPDFCYYEYPGGEHWFGDISVDWPPIFEFFSRQSIPAKKEVKSIDFHTASPAISASDYWIKIEQQVSPYSFTNVKAAQDKDTIKVELAQNVALLVLDLPAMQFAASQVAIDIDGQRLTVPANTAAKLALRDGKWTAIESIDKTQKYAERYGGFKQAFDNKVVLVYGTIGGPEDTEWNRNKARFDAETFYYRGNGSIEVIPDTEYTVKAYGDRNVVLYGNYDNNYVWGRLLKDCPIQVRNGEINLGNKIYKGDDLGTYFVYPHPDSETAYVGVVGGTGQKGLRATSLNNYISGITGFPDLMIFRADMLKDGLPAMEAAGYFDNDWTLTKQDIVSK